MAEQFEFSFSMPQVEALVKALEECAIDSGSDKAALERFRTMELVNAARAAHGQLRGKGQRPARSRGTPEVTRELVKDSAVTDVREAYRKLKD